MKKKIILSSIVTIALCLCLIAGSTFALFTSERNLNIAVQSGTVDIEAVLTDLTVYSFDKEDPRQDGKTFELGGTAEINAEKDGLDLQMMVPGDAVKVTIDITNNSDVAVQYKVRMIATDALAPALKAVATMGDPNVAADQGGRQDFVLEALDHDDPTQGLADADGIKETTWQAVEQNGDIDDIEITVSFPNLMDHDIQNQFQNKSANVRFQIIAVQGNGTEIYDYTENGGLVLAEKDDLNYIQEDLLDRYTNDADHIAELNISNDLALDAGEGALITDDMLTESGRLFFDGNDNAITADALVDAEKPTSIYMTNVKATVDNGIEITSGTNMTIFLGDSEFILPAGGKIVNITDTTSPVVVYVFGTITVKDTSGAVVATINNSASLNQYADEYLTGCTFYYMGSETFTLEDIRNA